MDQTRKPRRKPRTSAVTESAAKAAPAAKGKTAVHKKAVGVLPGATRPTPGDREERVRLVAYLRAERRGFARGYELEDWLAAEAEVTAITAPPRGARQPSGHRRRGRDTKV